MKNTHLPHLEDLLFIEADALIPLRFLEKTFFFLCGQNTLNISVKWDGAPAFVCGKHPENGLFFVGAKSVFSRKNRKICYTNQHIDYGYSDTPGLANKLHHLYNNLIYLDWDGVYQGDLLWTGLDGYCLDHTFQFRANLLKYKIPVDEIPDLGAVLHTTYTGNIFETMEAQFGAKVPEHGPNIVLFEPSMSQMYNILSNDEKEYFLGELEIMWKNAMHINANYKGIFQYYGDKKLLSLFQKYTNECLVQDIYFPEVIGFMKFVDREYQGHIDSLKTFKGKVRVSVEQQKLKTQFDYLDLNVIFNYYRKLMKLKVWLINKLDTVNPCEIYLPDGKPCGHEGYVMSDTIPCKFVNRHIFSKYNFVTAKDWK